MFKQLEFLGLHNSHFKASLTQNSKAARLQIILSWTSFFFFSFTVLGRPQTLFQPFHQNLLEDEVQKC